MKEWRYQTLDITRGLAALSVFVAHWGGWTQAEPIQNAGDVAVSTIQKWIAFVWCAGGIHPGVVVFIVLSGFCIHFPLACQPLRRCEPGFWKSYFIRRTLRIGPVFWFAIFLGVLFTALGLYYPAFRPAFNSGLLSGSGILVSFGGLAEVGRYFLPAETLYPGNAPLCSVGAEIVLYASYPILLAVHRRAGIAAVLGIGATGFGIIAAFRFAGVQPEFLHGTFFEFLLYWIFGAISVECFARFKAPWHGRVGWVVSLMLGAAYVLIGHGVAVRGMHVLMTPLMASACAAGLYAVTFTESVNMTRFKRLRVFLGTLSDRSYSFFACHTPVLAMTILAIRLSNHGAAPFAERWLGLIAVVLATEFSYRLIERPSHLLAKRIGQMAKPPSMPDAGGHPRLLDAQHCD